MKRILLTILLFLLFSASNCDKEQSSGMKYEFERTYNSTQETLSLTDVYYQLKFHGIDSIPMDSWANVKLSNDKGHLIQKILIQEADTVRYDFIYTTLVSTDSTYFMFKIRKVAVPKKTK